MSATGGLRLVAGMVGGGEGADIGKTHRHAMRLDDQYVLAAGVFGRNPDASAQMAQRLGVPADRVYRDYVEMAHRESERADGVDVVTVATPNDSHFAIASAFLRNGISVVCEKPLTQNSATAAELIEIAESSGAILAVPHCYSAYAMVRHAARLVRDGELGAGCRARPRPGCRRGGRPRLSSSPATSRPAGARTRKSRVRQASSAISGRMRFTCCATSPACPLPGFPPI